MTAPYKEKDFEDAIEAHLLAHGWLKGTAADFDRELALDPKHLFTFVEDTQPDLWGELRKNHKDGLEQTLTDTLVRTLESRGTLDCYPPRPQVLRQEDRCCLLSTCARPEPGHP